MASQTSGVDNSYTSRDVLIQAVNASAIGAAGGRTSQLRGGNQNVLSTNPMFGRPIWTYTDVVRGPVRGPQPRLSVGTGHTGDPSLPGNAPQLPGYLADNQYFPTTFTYDPVHKPSFEMLVPKTINTGNNGRDIVGTYEPHDFTPGQRFNHQMRQAANWQVMEYPPDLRNLLAWQQVRKYRVQSLTLSPRPLDSSNYFLGYQINPAIQAAIGQGTIGYMGSQ